MGILDSAKSMLGLGGATSSTSTKKQNIYTPEQQKLLDTLAKQTQKGLTSGVTAYPGEMYTPLSDIENQYLSSVSATTPARASAFESLLSGKPAYEINPATTEAYYQSAIRDPAMREYQDTTLPLLTESFSGPSFWSSNRAEQTQKSIQDLSEYLDTQHANLAYQDEQARRTALENAYSRMSGAVTAQPFTELGTAGQYARNVANEKVAADLNRWLMGESVGGVSAGQYNPYVNIAMSLLGFSPYTFTSSSESGGPGLGYQIVSGLAQAGGAAAGAALGSSMTQKATPKVNTPLTY